MRSYSNFPKHFFILFLSWSLKKDWQEKNVSLLILKEGKVSHFLLSRMFCKWENKKKIPNIGLNNVWYGQVEIMASTILGVVMIPLRTSAWPACQRLKQRETHLTRKQGTAAQSILHVILKINSQVFWKV